MVGIPTHRPCPHTGLTLPSAFGFVVLYSASNQSAALVQRQAINILIAMGVMLIFAQIPSHHYERWVPTLTWSYSYWQS